MQRAVYHSLRTNLLHAWCGWQCPYATVLPLHKSAILIHSPAWVCEAMRTCQISLPLHKLYRSIEHPMQIISQLRNFSILTILLCIYASTVKEWAIIHTKYSGVDSSGNVEHLHHSMISGMSSRSNSHCLSPT